MPFENLLKAVSVSPERSMIPHKKNVIYSFMGFKYP